MGDHPNQGHDQGGGHDQVQPIGADMGFHWIGGKAVGLSMPYFGTMRAWLFLSWAEWVGDLRDVFSEEGVPAGLEKALPAGRPEMSFFVEIARSG